MAVPAHDERDWEFAKKFNLPIIEVVAGGNVEEAAYTDVATGKLVNSGFLNGLEVSQAKKKMISYLTEKGVGSAKTNFKLRDWVFSRQRYWGEPIPLVNCEKCGWVAIPEDQLPLELPDVDIDTLTDIIWNNLNEDNKVSLFVRYIDLATGEYESRIVNKNV